MRKASPLAALAAKARRGPLTKYVEARVVRRQWASWDIWSPEPYYFERNQYGRGRKLARQPSRKQDAQLHGYDAQGRVVRIRSWSGFLEAWHEDELFVWSDHELVAYRFRENEALLNVHRYTFDGVERLLRHEVYFAEAKRTGEQRYVWENGLLARVDVKNWGHSWSLEHDDLGRLKSIATIVNGHATETYRRPERGETLSALLDAIYERLRSEIPRVVAKVRPSTEIYALALVVDEEEWRYSLPPSLVLGLETARVKRRAGDREHLPELLWNAGDMFESSALDLKDGRLERLCERANQHIWKKNAHGRVNVLVRKLARELQGLDWATLRAVTDDFVVYATALEGGGPAHVKRDAPKKIVARLRKRGDLA